MKHKTLLYPGDLFVFEGLDNTGKTSLSRQFASLLRSQGKRCHHWALPGHDRGTLGKVVYDFHHAPEVFGTRACHPASLQALHVAAHIDAIEERILPALEAGETVVLDRYWWSTWVYGLADGVEELSLKAMIALEQVHWKGVSPVLVFLVVQDSVSDGLQDSKSERMLRTYEELASEQETMHPVCRIAVKGSACDALTEVTRAVAAIGDGVRRCVSPSHALSGSASCSAPEAPHIFARLAPTKSTAVYDTYWRFAAERQAIFFRRLHGDNPPWTSDPILHEHKFTNAYRASDRVSQYLIRHVIYDYDQDVEEVVFRILLFKLFNKIETWETLVDEFGLPSYREFSLAAYDRVLEKTISQGERIYSAAYIMPTGGKGSKGTRKHQLHLRLLERMMEDELHKRLADAPSMSRAFDLLRAYPMIGDFLAYQFATDVNYSNVTDFGEMDFVVPGPGARDGLRKCFSDFGGLNGAELIKLVADRQEEEFRRLGIEFEDLWGRPLQLIDCQNLFCETDKYARVAHPDVSGHTNRTRIKQKFRPSSRPLSVWYPPKWGINRYL